MVLEPAMASSSNQNTTFHNLTINNTNPQHQQTQINFSFNIPMKLDWSNYWLWRSQVLALIRGNWLEDFITAEKLPPEQYLLPARVDGSTQVDNLEYYNWWSQDQTLLRWLLSLINESTLSLVINYVNSFDVWRTLEKKFSVQSKAIVLQLRYELNALKKVLLSVEDYFIKMKQRKMLCWPL